MFEKTVPSGSLSRSRDSIEWHMVRLAREQHGLVTTAQLRELGMRSGTLSKWVAKGRLHRVHRGVFSVGHDSLATKARWHAAVLGSGPGAVLSHAAAAHLWRIWCRKVPEGIDVVVPVARRSHIPGVRVHVSRGLTPDDIRVVRGIPVTSVPRTVLDLGDRLTVPQLAKVLHEAEFRRRFDEPGIQSLLRRSRGRTAAHTVRLALAMRRGGSVGTRSELEDLYLDHLCALGVRVPSINVRVPTNSGMLEVDLLWPEHRLIVEIDGSGHRREATRRDDERRDRALRTAGFTVLRCPPHALAEHALEVAAIVS